MAAGDAAPALPSVPARFDIKLSDNIDVTSLLPPPRSNSYAGKRPDLMDFRQILEVVFQPELSDFFR